MKSIIRLSLLLVLSTAMFTSCKKSAPKQTRHIPKNAVFVAAINTNAITTKLANSQATIENLFKSMADNDTAVNNGKKEWEEFQNAGIDLSENFYFSVAQKGGGMGMGGGTSLMSGIGALKDASKLEAYIKKKKPEAEIRKEKDYSYATMEGNTMIAWGEDLVIALSSAGTGGRMQFDSITGEYNFQQPPSSENDLKAEMTAYFNMKEDESVASLPEFRDLMKDNADASFWMNSAASMANMPIPLPKVKELVENSYTAATLNFEEGKVVVNSKSYSSPALNEILKKYSGPTVDLGLIEKYPSNNINGFMAFAFNPEMINAIVTRLEMKAMVDGQLSNMFGGNFTLQDLTKAIKGDMAVIVSDFTMPGDTTRGMTSSASPFKMIVNIPVGDKTQMNRLMDKAVEMGLMIKSGTEYRATEAISRSGYQIVVDDKNLLISSDAETLAKYQSGTGKATLGNEVVNDFDDKIAVFYVDIESILNGVPVNANNADMNSLMPKAKETFRDIKGYADNFNGKYTEGHGELRFKNVKENSLVSLLQFFGEVGKITKNSKRSFQFERESEEIMDSTVIE